MDIESVRNTARRLRVGVLCGGPSPSRERSLVSGTAVMEALRNLEIECEQIDPIDVDLVSRLCHVDIAFMAVPGWFGEDGTLQGLLEALNVSYTGSGIRASAIGMHKPTLKRFLQGTQILTPQFVDIEMGRHASGVELDGMTFPLIIKPTIGGGSDDCNLVKNQKDLKFALKKLSESPYTDFFAETYIPGKDISVGILGSVENPRLLPILEIRSNRVLYDTIAKSDPSQRQYVCPAEIPIHVRDHAQKLSVRIFRLLGAKGPVRIDMVIASDQVWVLEINTCPGLSRQGNLAFMARAAGMSYRDLILAILTN